MAISEAFKSIEGDLKDDRQDRIDNLLNQLIILKQERDDAINGWNNTINENLTITAEVRSLELKVVGMKRELTRHIREKRVWFVECQELKKELGRELDTEQTT